MNRKDMLKRLAAGENALELSIEKWQDIVDGMGKNVGNDNCALCHVSKADWCEDCLVYKRTRKGSCYDTPYYDYADAVSTKQRKIAAQEEVEFLKSLRKGGSKTE